MDHNELARRMGVTCTGSSSQGDKKRMHLKDGGRASESSEGTWKTSPKQEAAEKREMDSGSKPMGKGAFYKPGIRENAYKIGSNPVRKKLGENGAGQLKPRVGASIGGDMENVGRRIKSGAEDAGRKIKNFLHLADGGKAEMRRVTCNPSVKTTRNPAKLEKAMIAPKAFARIDASIGGDMENVSRKIKSGAEKGLNRAKSGAEDFGRKAKAGLEDFGSKFRNAFHFQEGGEVEAPASMAVKPAKMVKKGSMGEVKGVKKMAKGYLPAKSSKSSPVV